MKQTLASFVALTGAASVILAGTALISPTAAVAAPSTDPLITTAGTTWRYLDDNTEPHRGAADVLAWTGASYDASDWKSATGSFGAIRGQLGSVSGYTPTTLLNQYVNGTSAPNVPTFFFRSTFEVDAATITGIKGLAAEVVYDDALRVYVNGKRVFNALDERASDTTRNLQFAGNSGGAPVTSTFTIAPEDLTAGTNTVAIALYQDRESSSDIYFDFKELVPVLTEAPALPPSRVILTPTEDTSRSQSFSWLAGNEGETVGRVQVQPTAGGLTRTLRGYPQGAVNNNPLEHFSATVAGLEPGTEYRYRVGNPAAWSEWFTFTTADPSVTDFSYIYYGDAQIGLDSTWPKVVDQSLATAPDAIGSVHAGDLIDTASNETQWVNWFKGMETAAATKNIMAAPGNHEYSGDRYLKAWKANFEYPLNQPTTETIGELADLAVGDDEVAAQYRAFFDHWTEFAAETVYFTDYQGVRFITVNATRDTGFLTPENLPACGVSTCPSTKVGELWTQFQAAWLDHVLSTTTSKWNVVTFHQPVYSTSAGRNEPVLRQYWVPVFQKHDIDLVQMGHDHTYARGYNNDDVTDQAGITDGPVYIVSNSGAKHYELETDERNVWKLNGATQVLRGAGVTTYQVIEVSKDQLVYKSYLAEKTADATTELPVGAVYDEFTVTKTDDGQKWVTEAGVDAPLPEPEPTVEISEHPVAQVSVEAGGDVTLTAGATATAGHTVSYQWQHRGAGGDWADVPGATQASLTLAKVSASQGGTQYRLVATASGVSAVSDVTTLVVRAATQVPPVVVAPPVLPQLVPTDVRPKVTKTRVGKLAVVRVRATADGTVRLVATRGKVEVVRVVQVTEGSARTVKLPRKLTKRAGKLVVSLTLTPTEATDLPSRTTLHTVVRR